MFNKSRKNLRPLIGITTVAANDDVMMTFSPTSYEDFRTKVFEHAPEAWFHICCYHPIAGKWYIIRNADNNTRMICKRAFIDKDTGDNAWSKINTMMRIHSRAERNASTYSDPKNVAHLYPNIPENNLLEFR